MTRQLTSLFTESRIAVPAVVRWRLIDASSRISMMTDKVDTVNHRYPHSIVWTPIPVLTWLLPFVGHMGICSSSGVIRDFAGPYVVGEDKMAFGDPVKYLMLKPRSENQWDECVAEASHIYTGRMHNLFCDNCHSHVATALDLMNYDNSSRHNMVQLAIWMTFCGKYINKMAVVKTFLPSIIIYALLITCLLLLS